MKEKRYRVEFWEGPDVIIYAFNSYEARVLAKAEKIKAGLVYGVKHVWETQINLNRG